MNATRTTGHCRQLENVSRRRGRGSASPHLVAVGTKDVSGVEIVLAPPFTALAAVAQELSELGTTRIGVAAQNVHPKSKGRTPERCAPGCSSNPAANGSSSATASAVSFFGETDASVHDKVLAALAAGLRPIVCVGETLEEREAGKNDGRHLPPTRRFCWGFDTEPWLRRHRVRAGLGHWNRQGRGSRASRRGAPRDPRALES